MFGYDSVQELVEAAEKQQKRISDLVIEDQMIELGMTRDELTGKMIDNLQVMKEAVNEGLVSGRKSFSGLSGGDAFRLNEALKGDRMLGGTLFGKALVKAIAIAEVNATMGRICASPTAGSCGILPAVVLAAAEELGLSDEEAAAGLFTAGGIGMIIAAKASISGAEGGCQAECGSASAMAAAALVELAGGTPRMAANACAIALKGVLGLVCDPVAGLVEVPCVKRNAMGAANALAAADMALAGIESKIPVDEVISAMKAIGDAMSPKFKETAEGGLADTPTGRRLAEKIFGNENKKNKQQN